MQLKYATGFLAFCTLSAVAGPLTKRRELDVWVPNITSPTSDTVWHIGDRVNVTWDTSDAPVQISNGASVLLNVHGRPAEDVPKLAQDFDLRAGFVEVTVPDVSPGTDYSITLFGDSGNTGENFAIVA
ncbi:hypothetical protein D9758_000962 [Tetrapyrgos nigripes]|uniref:Yeast cell wall synthesis Kre9/Knh1-like N-terminal domain-containing protein n=1 Tax=Tetrapyrgos nigripes TaxID=182062 RepID=A0A8H5GYS8_9AGAR|nr:hypothetical protein D9758_000962 [Tetrapyrgos nigripes]